MPNQACRKLITEFQADLDEVMGLTFRWSIDFTCKASLAKKPAFRGKLLNFMNFNITWHCYVNTFDLMKHDKLI